MSARERAAEDQLAEAVTEAAMSLQVEREVLAVLGNDNAAVFTPFTSDVV